MASLEADELSGADLEEEIFAIDKQPPKRSVVVCKSCGFWRWWKEKS